MPSLALIGHGAVGAALHRHLRRELDDGRVVFRGALVRHPDAHPELPAKERLDLDGLLAADLVVECAGVAALRHLGPLVVAGGPDLLVASVGAFADPDTAAALEAGPGRVRASSGAIGGLDLLRAAAQAGGIDRATITTTKLASSLVQPWMDDEERERLRTLRTPEPLFEGTPGEAIDRFPGNVNVAVAVGLACRGLGPIAAGLGRVRVRIVADPDTDASTHRIEAEGASGRYRFEIANRPDPTNPRSSALTAQALAAEVREWLAARPT
ncbi:DUF108 domain-containing protein [Pseudoclavibacter chungangensis]|uniref:L-aspartate dehydrogenase n=1 Tax=Pseudoclavibacter chungangensis TaxID=587635 RepID=A0A7J5BQX9_9MICO|nr:aspartate dehydrogenase domain-containing protein [Pseudoclavibacter chungangensis]KAB1656693.1 DUF108 domain-containing protein [Pseudoclavibacter chungangensis]NYJ67853.1 aspartate dehydrogenase [Pseudoclavibacter chungangensis]